MGDLTPTKDKIRIGWLSPDGEAYETCYMGHSSLTFEIMQKFYPNIRAQHEEDFLMAHGWCKLCGGGMMGFNAGWVGEFPRFTDKQFEYLSKYEICQYGDNGNDILKMKDDHKYMSHFKDYYMKKENLEKDESICLCQRVDISWATVEYLSYDTSYKSRYVMSDDLYCPLCGQKIKGK